MAYEMIKKQVITENETYCKNMLEAIEKREVVLQRESTPTRWKQSHYNALPYFEGGVGIECFVSILQKAGYKCNRNCTDDTNSYFFYK